MTGNIFLHLSRLAVGVVFIFSGFVKAIDPYGFSYKIQDYLTSFGSGFQKFNSLAFGAAIALSTFEFLIGLNLVFQIHLKRTTILAFLFMLVMLPLTLYIALFNPVTDCGCFGEALVISNWATFYKNVVLIALIILIWLFNNRFRKIFMPAVEWILVLVFVLSGVGISVYSYFHLPFIDFLPYKVGVNIPNAMEIPMNAPKDVYNTTFIYKKNGVEKEFTLDNYPKGDSIWTFVDQKTTLIKKGYQPAIHDFTVTDEKLNDITDIVIRYEGNSYLVIMNDLNKTPDEGAFKAEELYQKYNKSATKFYALTASSDDEIAAFRKRTGATFPFCKTDGTALKSIIRANPGFLLINNGTITGKWSWRDF